MFTFLRRASKTAIPLVRNSVTAENAGRLGLGLIGAGIVGSLGGLAFLSNEPREREIRAKAFDLSGEKSTNLYKAEGFQPYIRGHGTEAGSLPKNVLQDTETGQLYIKKGARSRDTFLREYVIANALALIRPGEQPRSLLLQDDVRKDGSARFYTLSEIYPNTKDLRQFIEEGNAVEKIKEKPITGFEQALASDGIFAKQQDAKYANYIITDTGSAYVVATIDHEFGGESIRYMNNKQIFTTDLALLANFVRDLFSQEEGDICNAPAPAIGMAGDARAIAFMDEAKKQMDREKVLDLYQRVAETDFQPLLDRLELMSRHSDLVKPKDVIFYSTLLKEMQAKAKEFVALHRPPNHQQMGLRR